MRRFLRSLRPLRLVRLRPGSDEDRQSGFAMMVALLLIVVVAGMSLLVAGLVISEGKPTTTERKIVGTVNAAESGFEVALHRLRVATDAYGNGILSKLPCTATSSAVGTPMNGSVGPNTGAANNQTLTYAVYVRYYDADPSTMGTTDLNQNAIACSGGAPISVPQYAYLQSNGVGVGGAGTSGTQGNRALHTTYHFKTSTLNIAGGRLNMDTTSLCMDAGSNPVVGTAVKLSTCQNRGVSAGQSSWSYRADLTIYDTNTGSPGLCITAGTTFGTNSTSQLTLQTCATDGTATTYPYQSSPSLQQRQEWSFDDNGKFEGAASNGNINGNCITANPYNNPVTGGFLYEQGCDGGGFDTETWNPDPQVGAGSAGPSTQGLVNYSEFGRCLDVTGQNVSATWLIDYPCKQAPDPSYIAWNQRWVYSSTSKTLVTTTGGVNYCLTAPTTLSPTPINNLVLVKPCDSSSVQTWTETGDTGSYATSYTIVSAAGSCLSVVQPGLGDAYNAQWGAIVATTCDGSLVQKWNAPPNFIDSRLKGTAEDAGGQ